MLTTRPPKPSLRNKRKATNFFPKGVTRIYLFKNTMETSITDVLDEDHAEAKEIYLKLSACSCKSRK
jgi:hypothetical protein